jgi:hypothetical protein
VGTKGPPVSRLGEHEKTAERRNAVAAEPIRVIL